MSCNVCASDFNKSSNIKISCFKCEYECCRKCVKMYMLSKTDNAHCMSCKVEWDRKFLTDNMDSLFMTKYFKEHRENVCFERELGMLQGTQVYVEKEIRVEALKNELKEVKTLIIELEKKRYEIERQLLIEKNVEIAVSDHKKFVRRCPNGECLGFLSSSLKCELCGIYACSECREIKGKTTEERESHKCDTEVVESIKMIDSDSKACPKCSSLIFKTEGCNQMYCVCCHTAFDWKTLKIETGEIHNPEYFEYLRRKGTLERNPNEVLCGREINDHLYTIIMDRLETLVSYDVQEFIKNIIVKGIHIRLVEQRRFRRDRLNDNLDLRIMYMRKQIDKEKFKALLQKREKDYSKSNEIHNVLAMFVNCLTEILYRINDNSKNSNADHNANAFIRDCILECNELRLYTNECLTRISKTYKSKEYQITKMYNFN